MQTEDKSIATRLPMEGGTKINMYFGDTLITGVLNDSKTARKALIEKLPMTQHMSRYSHDFCGVTEELFRTMKMTSITDGSTVISIMP